MNNQPIGSFTHQKVTVLGFGVEGKSVVQFLVDRHAKITVFDNKSEEEFEKGKVQSLKEKGVLFHFGSFPKDFLRFDILVRSPGVNPSLPQIQDAIQNSISVTSPTNIFFELCPCPIIGVTGTKGKGTTASLIYEMLKTQGFDAYLGGNIGVPPLDFLDKLTKDSWVVLELSSFQLQDLHASPHFAPSTRSIITQGRLEQSRKATALRASRGKPHITVILMITSEHLDYHKDVMEYVNAKRNILRFQTASDYTIINRDYLASNESDIHTNGQIFQVSREREVKRGCFVRGRRIFTRTLGKLGRSVRQLADQNIRISKTHKVPILRQSESSEFSEIEIIKTKDILLPGAHNLENVCAAVMAATLAGVSVKNIVKVLKTFKGLPHRLELVATIKGVRYYDDSFSTTPETAIAAIEAFDAPKILILGGSSKGSDFTHLGEVILKHADSIKAIIGIGKEWQRMKAQFPISNFQFPIIEDCKNMKEIVQATSKIAEIGDIVLLSPACASFDMFKNYKHRGEEFKAEVQKLKN